MHGLQSASTVGGTDHRSDTPEDGDPLRHTPTTPAPAWDGSAHRVAFYDTDADLVDLVVGAVRPAARDGVAVVVATADHRQAVTAALRAGGVDTGAAVRSGRLVLLDAGETLARVLSDGALDPAAFEAVIGGVLDRAARVGGPVRVYGEMVTVLWEQGRVAAAMRLEELWNEQAATRAFGLLCGYPSALFAHPSAVRRFEAVCGRHTDVTLPTGGRAWLPTWGIGSRHPDDRAVRWQFPAALTSGAWARAKLRRLLVSWELPHLLDEAELLTSELVNNAVVHGRSRVSVAVRHRPDGLQVEVTDEGPGTLQRLDAGVEAAAGRGLMLVDAVSTAWGTSVEGDAKTVWFRLRTGPAA